MNPCPYSDPGCTGKHGSGVRTTEICPSALERKRQRNRARRVAGATVMRPDWELPDDGIIDEVAVDAATRGIRPVKLTRPEMLLAVENIAHMGLSAAEAARRTGISDSAAQRIMHKLEAN